MSFPTVGVKLSVFRDLLAEIGPSASTSDLNNKIILKLTENESYAEYLRKKTPEVVGEANCFVSHAWSYVFAHVVDALETVENAEDNFYWFDAICVNQHKAVSLEYDQEWWSNTFQQAIKAFNNTLLILNPWDNPKPLHRAWCLWEIFSTVVTKSKFQVIMPRNQKGELLHAVITGGASPIMDAFSKIDGENAQAFHEKDRQMIFQAIKNMDGGFSFLNQTVTGAMRAWLEGTLLEALKSQEEKNGGKLTEESMVLSENIAWVFENFGKFEKAESLYRACLAFNYERGKASNPTITSVINISNLLTLQNKSKVAADIMLPIIQDIEQETIMEEEGAEVRFYLKAILYQNYGACLGRLNDSEGALKNYRESLRLNRLLPAEKREAARELSLESNIATCLIELRKFDEGFDAMKICILKRSSLLGNDHIDTCRSKIVYAQYFMKYMPKFSNQDLAEVLEMAEEAYSGYCKSVGPNSYFALSSIKIRGEIYAHQGKSELAVEDFFNSLHGLSVYCKLPVTAGEFVHASQVLGPKGMIALLDRFFKQEEEKNAGVRLLYGKELARLGISDPASKIEARKIFDSCLEHWQKEQDTSSVFLTRYLRLATIENKEEFEKELKELKSDQTISADEKSVFYNSYLSLLPVSSITCPNSHGLRNYCLPNEFYSCDICGESQKKGNEMFGCSKCNYDLCPKCHQQAVDKTNGSTSSMPTKNDQLLVDKKDGNVTSVITKKEEEKQPVALKKKTSKKCSVM